VLNTNDYYFVTAVRNSGTIKIYVNGSEEDSGSSSEGISAADTFIGTHAGLSTYFDGKIDETGFWDKALTSTEITALYNSGTGIAYPFVESITANFNYEIDYETEIVSLIDNSSVNGTLEITDWNWLKDGNVLSTDQNTSFSITPNTDYNICLTVDTNNVFTDSTCKTIEVGGELRLNFYDDDSSTGLDEMYLEFGGTSYYSDSNTFIMVDLNGITSGITLYCVTTNRLSRKKVFR